MKPSKRTIRREKKKKNEEIQRSLVTTLGNMKIATTTTTHNQSYDVPLDLIPEILSRLPAKSVVRFRAVCKDWYYITTTPDFIKSFTRPPSLLLTFRSSKWEEVNKGRLALSFKSQCQLVFSFPQNSNLPQGSSYESYQMIDESYQMIDTSLEWAHPLSESVHGLVLLSEFIIWNPTTRQFFALPFPEEKYRDEGSYGYKFYLGLGYDPVEGKHRVLHLSEQARVLTLGPQEFWRVITEDIPRNESNDYIPSKGPCFNGIMYFDISSSIMSFDVRTEKFKLIKYPEDYHARLRDIHMHHKYYTSMIHMHREYYTSMIPYEGRLALVYYPKLQSDYEVDLWILEDAVGDIWTHKCFLLPLDPTEFRDLWLTFRGVTEAGEFIFTSWCGSSSFRILYFDPRRNRIRDSLFNGIDIDDRCKCYAAIFPNHIESLLYT